MKTVEAKIKGTSAILEGCICVDSFFVSVDYDTFERYDLDEIELCEPNPNSLTLEEAAEEYVDTICPVEYPESFNDEQLRNAFKSGAEWQKDKDIRDMYMSDNRHLEKIYELGKKDMKEQMMKEAVEGRVISNDGISFPVSNEIHRLELIEGDKVRIIILPKEDGE